MKSLLLVLLVFSSSTAFSDEGTVFINCDEANSVNGAQCPTGFSPPTLLTANTNPPTENTEASHQGKK